MTCYALQLASLVFVRPGEWRMSETTVNGALRRLGWSGSLAWRPGNGQRLCAEAYWSPESPKQGTRPLSLGSTWGWLCESVMGTLASDWWFEIPIRARCKAAVEPFDCHGRGPMSKIALWLTTISAL